ncbi:MAG: SPFH domain-containing protein [bacterium]
MILLSTATTIGAIAFLIIFFVIIISLISGIKVVRQTDKYIVERLGAYHKTWGVGIHFTVPFIDKVCARISLKEQVKDFDPQPVITKDNVTMQIDTVVFYSVTDPKLYCYGVENPINALENLSATTLRNIIGELDLDQTLTSRDIINSKMRSTLDEATDPWGIKVNRVEVKNIVPPKDIRDAMEKQMRAEREKRESILRAQGEKESAILLAQGEKESAILRAEGEKEQMIRLAEGAKQELISHAEGNAESIRINKEAEALGIKLIKEAKADSTVLTLKSLETFAKVSEGQATKIIIPSEIQNLAGLITSVTEISNTAKEKNNK